MAITTRTRPDRHAAVVDVTIRDYLNTLFYYRRIATTVFLAIVALGVLVALFVPIPYRAQATLLVLNAGYYDQTNNPNGGVSLQPPPGQLNGVEAQILSSPELHRDVILSKLGPGATASDIDRELQNFEKRLHIEQNDLANTITLTYSDTDPKAAADALARLLDKYFRQRASIFTQGRVNLLVSQRDDVGKQLDKADGDLLAFQKKHGIVKIDDQTSRAVQLESQLVQRKLETDAKLAQDRSELKSLQSSTKDVRTTIPIYTDDSETSRAINILQGSLSELENKRADFASRYMATSPFVVQLDKQIADMRANIAKQRQEMMTATRMGHNNYFDVVQERLAVLNASIAGGVAQQSALEAQIKETRDKLQGMSDVSSQLSQLQARRDILADSFKERSRQVELARVQQGQVSQINGTNVRVIQAPFPPSQRSVSASLLIAASIAAGLLISALTVLIMSSLRETFLSPEQVERALLLPVVNAPVLLGGDRRGATAAGAAGGVGANVEPAYARPAHLAYGRMIAAINSSTDSVAKVVMALSTGKNDGLSSVIQGLTSELEHRSGKPILILDIASTPDSPMYGKPNAQGLLEWPSNGGSGTASVDAVKPTGTDESSVLADLTFTRVDGHNIVVAQPHSGAVPSSWQLVTRLFDALRESHDYIVVHAPPSSQSFTGIENAPLADATVLVVRAEATRKPVIAGLKAQVEDAGGRLIGVALTHRRGYIPSFIYRFF
ncbi:lipopolysaccharide biosynthesis protein [Pandoraea sputorum]|uniref:Capsular polysaccharide biosynthesis protein n=1 Tax=Pandoraea sputorum TaxID=93222 RepID=A0A239SVN1_9BURK|nr:Capsular polysaccharide biosynthesis protein [Pandoraea sputorum]VVE19102.1 lipopolysaccharide biosynthesis protein [Pandoraea sputorum]